MSTINKKYVFNYATLVRVVSEETGWIPKFALKYPSANIGLGPNGKGFNSANEVFRFAKEENIAVSWEGTTF